MKQLTAHCVARDYLAVMLPARERERVVGQLQEVGLSTDGLKLPIRLEVVGHRNDVNGNGSRVHFTHRFEDDAMSGTEEAFRAKLQGDFLEHARRKKACCKNGLLRFDILRQRFARVFFSLSGAFRHVQSSVSYLMRIKSILSRSTRCLNKGSRETEIKKDRPFGRSSAR